METAMKLRTNATLFALRTTARLAWALAGLSRALGALGERIEVAVDRKALRCRLDITEALEPLVTERLAG
jgi:hypothetical protein